MTVELIETRDQLQVLDDSIELIELITQGEQGVGIVEGNKGVIAIPANLTDWTLNDNVVTSSKIVDGTIVNADINDNAAIALTKLATGALPTAITVTSANISDLSIVDADINASASIQGTKINPNFGSQHIVTSGHLQITSNRPTITLTESDAEPDYDVVVSAGEFKIRSEGSGKIIVRNDGHIDLIDHVDISSGLDVTGNVAATGDLSAKNITLTDNNPTITWTDTDNNPDYRIEVNGGNFTLHDITNAVNKFEITPAGNIEFVGHTDFLNGGVDITGNLTVSGNMTVSGTTTTIDTTTLTVEDKNIELGKVSTPTDTTADGGGLTLKGATDKTFQWLDATDSWTSSEHIALPDNKKLQLGASQDLELYHSGNNSFIKNSGVGFLALLSDQFTLNNEANSENIIQGFANGAVNLYYDNSKKFETTADGINVVGKTTITQSDQSLLALNVSGNTKFQGAGNSGDVLFTGASGKDLNWNKSDGSLDFTDNTKARFGDNYRLQISASNTLSRFRLEGGVPLTISKGTTEDIAKFIPDGAVELYYDNSRKIFTTSTGTQISCGSDGDGLKLQGTTNRIDIVADTNRGGAAHTILELDAQWNSTSVAFIAFGTGDDTINRDDGRLRFFTKPSGGTIAERLKIEPDGNVQIPADNAKLQIGASQDLEIYHSGHFSFIKDTGTGGLAINTNNLLIRNAANNEEGLTFTENGKIELYYDGSKKLETTVDGVQVTGSTGAFVEIRSSGAYDAGLVLTANNNDSTDWSIRNDESASNLLDFRFNGTSKANLNSSGTLSVTGQLGIGTFSPLEKLDVFNGCVNVGYSGNTSGDKILLKGFGNRSGSSTFGNVSIRSTYNNSTNAGSLDFYTASGGLNTTKRLEITSDGNIQIPADNKKLQIGESQDLEFSHEGTYSLIKNKHGYLQINATDTERGIFVNPNGAVRLLYDNAIKLDTTATGATVTGSLVATSNIQPQGALKLGNGNYAIFGASNGMFIYHSGNTGFITNNVGALKILSDNINIRNNAEDHEYIVCNNQTSVDLYYDNSKKLETTSTGIDVTGKIRATQNIEINADNMEFRVGANGEFRISHTGSDNILRSDDDIKFRNMANNETIADFKVNDSVNLYYDNSVKLQTTSTGVSVTGGIVGSADATINSITVGRGGSNNSNNTAVGYQALQTTDNNAYNCTAVGRDALGSANLSARENTAVGQRAMRLNETSRYNVAVGFRALDSMTGGGSNVAIGNKALDQLTEGNANVAIGASTGSNVTTGSNNVLIKGGQNVTTASNIIAIGSSTCASATNSNNIGIGNSVFSDQNFSGSYNIGLGWNAATNNSSGSYNIAMGRDAMIGSHTAGEETTGNHNVAIGYHAQENLKDGTHNTGIGQNALRNNVSGNYNLAFGNNALNDNDSGDYNIALGVNASQNNTSGTHNISIGFKAGQRNTTLSNNIALGQEALMEFVATNNVAIGVNAMEGVNGSSTGSNNVAIGSNALRTNLTGANNVCMGVNAGYSMAGSQNVAIGANTSRGGNNTQNTGNNNTACGYAALNSIRAGGQNVAVGNSALSTMQSESNNTALGSTAFQLMAAGHSGVAIGQRAGRNNQASYNTFIGDRAADANNISGSFNTGIGQSTLKQLSSGSNNTAVGQGALQDITQGVDNTACGKHSLANTTSGSYNTACGTVALHTNTTGQKNTAVGWYSSHLNTDGHYNVAVGYQALKQNQSSDYNVAIGYEALFNNTGSIGNNVAVGRDASRATTSGYSNVALGSNTNKLNQTGFYNTVIGHDALSNGGTNVSGIVAIGFEACKDTTNGGNTAVGYRALKANTGGYWNTAFGSNALAANTTHTHNSAFGQNALMSATASFNDAFGWYVLQNNTTGHNNSVFGVGAGQNVSTGSENVLMGSNAGTSITTTSRNVAIGREALQRINGSNSIAIGYQAIQGTSGAAQTAHSNVGIGYKALQDVQTAHSNVAVGYQALVNNLDSHYNVAIGYNALTSYTGVGHAQADGATVVGYKAMENSVFDIYSCAFGYLAAQNVNQAHYTHVFGYEVGQEISTGGGNHLFGFRAGKHITTGGGNCAFGSQALAGSSSAKATGNYNSAFGEIALQNVETARQNSALGRNALNGLTEGRDNTGVGMSAAYGCTTGNYNSILGSHVAGALSSGSYNVGIGALSAHITTGSNNIIMGYQVAENIHSGSHNIALGFQSNRRVRSNNNVTIGYQAGHGGSGASSNTTDINAKNVIIGYQAAYNITTGKENVAIGNTAMKGGTAITGQGNGAIGNTTMLALTSGNYNNCYGESSLRSLTSGVRNTGLGHAALMNLTDGDHNTGLGDEAGLQVTTGNNNTCVGHNAGNSGSPSGAIGTSSNIICLGDNNVTDLYCAETAISASDKRDKTDIVDFTHGLDWVNQLKPVTYRWDKRTWYGTDEQPLGTPDGSKKRNKKHVGFLAQDVLAIEGNPTDKDDMLIAILNEDDTAYGIKYERLVPVLVNAIKELSAKVKTLEAG